MNNRLDEETSPYLRQHRDNPVHWQPWDAAALEQARAEHRPILLSIGYSACHWCHVMAHESFEDAATAELMNTLFVNIKVDREERPDLDRIYQAAQQLLTQQQGGWPLTMFLDPDTLLPFFGGTYFPRTARHGLPGFKDLLRRVAQAFADKEQELKSQGEKVASLLEQLGDPATAVRDEAAAPAADALARSARDQLAEQYDAAAGGFGQAPKFPMPGTLAWLLQHSAAGGPSAREDRDMVLTSLTRMARGGIFDHLGGGFCRYSTDRQWMIPHFEKMLYDNGQLLALYADGLAFGPDRLFEDAVRDTVGWLLREMRHPEGGFYAALDADSEGEEGRFYVWRRDQVRKLLTEDEYLVVETLYGLDKPANFEGRWNLHRHDAWRSVVHRLSLDPARADALLASARAKLFEARSARVRPGLDDKILTGWNGLAISGLVQAGARLREPGWLDAAADCARFLYRHLWQDSVLRATWKGDARYGPYLDDHAFVLDGLLQLLQHRYDDDLYGFALALGHALLEQFEDHEHGGFFFTAHGSERLIQRPKPTIDDAVPAGNGVAARALLRLGHLSGEPRFLDAAARTLKWAAPAMARYPAGHCTLLSAQALDGSSFTQVILRGDPEQLAPFEARLPGGYHPALACYRIPWRSQRLPDYLRGPAGTAAATAYVCRGLQCSLPITEPDALAAALS